MQPNYFFLLESMLTVRWTLSSPAGCHELSENTLYNCHSCFNLNVSPSTEVPLDFHLHRNTYQYKWFIQNLSLPITIMLSEDRITSGRIRYEYGLFCCKVADQMCVYAFFHQIWEMQKQIWKSKSMRYVAFIWLRSSEKIFLLLWLVSLIWYICVSVSSQFYNPSAKTSMCSE